MSYRHGLRVRGVSVRATNPARNLEALRNPFMSAVAERRG
jgi:hypothetical protein